MHKLSSSQNLDKVIALSILAVLVLVLLLLFSNVYLDGLSEIDKEAELLRRKTDKVDGILAREKFYQQEIAKVKRQYSQARNFLNSTQPSTASSELQNKLKSIISRNTKAKILTVKPFPVVNSDGYSEVSVEIRMKQASHDDIHKMLYLIEKELPLIIIKDIDIAKTAAAYKSILGKVRDSGDMNMTFVASSFFRDASKS